MSIGRTAQVWRCSCEKHLVGLLGTSYLSGPRTREVAGVPDPVFSAEDENGTILPLVHQKDEAK